MDAIMSFSSLCAANYLFTRALHVLCDIFLMMLHVLFVTLHIRFVGIYHVPRNIAVITVRYHT